MELTPLAANGLAAILEERTGQQLSGSRRWRLETSLQPVMRAYDCSSLEMLAVRARDGSNPEGARMRIAIAEALLNNETSFFRDRAAFDQLRDQVLPALASARIGRRLRIWCAGCSTGQEAYSLAMLFAAAPERWSGWSIDITGTDVSGAAIARAREGRYAQMEVQRGLGVHELLAHFVQEDDHWRLRPQIASHARFATGSLLESVLPGQFDLILCRNVLLYFGDARRRAVFDRLAGALAEDGVLILGAGETVLGQTDAFRPDPVYRGCYRRVLPQSAGASNGMGAMSSAA